MISAYYSFIVRPRKDERLSWPSWLTCSGRLTHVSGHPSAAGRAQDRESTSASWIASLLREWFVFDLVGWYIRFSCFADLCISLSKQFVLISESYLMVTWAFRQLLDWFFGVLKLTCIPDLNWLMKPKESYKSDRQKRSKEVGTPKDERQSKS